MSATPLERLIDAMQRALLTAQAVDFATHDLSDESRHLLNAVQSAARCAHDLRTAGLTSGSR